MKKVLILGASVWLAAAAASAAEIHGTVSENGKPLPRGVAVKLECGAESRPTAKTDDFGSYSVKIAGDRGVQAVGRLQGRERLR